MVLAWSVTLAPGGAVNAWSPVPAAGFVRVAILAPGLCPDAACSETVGVAPDRQAPTSRRTAVRVQGPPEAPVLNCIAVLWMERTGIDPEAVACPVLPTSVRASWPNAAGAAAQMQIPATSGRTRHGKPPGRRRPRPLAGSVEWPVEWSAERAMPAGWLRVRASRDAMSPASPAR